MKMARFINIDKLTEAKENSDASFSVLNDKELEQDINNAIKAKWDSIDKYQSLLQRIEQSMPTNEELRELLSTIIDDETIHVGLLEKGLSNLGFEVDTEKVEIKPQEKDIEVDTEEDDDLATDYDGTVIKDEVIEIIPENEKEFVRVDNDLDDDVKPVDTDAHYDMDDDEPAPLDLSDDDINSLLGIDTSAFKENK